VKALLGLFYFLMTYSVVAQAASAEAPRCENLFLYQATFIAKENVTQAQISKFNDALVAINNFARPLEIPKDLEVIVYDQQSHPESDLTKNRLMIGAAHSGSEKDPSGLNHAVIIFAHEYGHRIFAQLLQHYNSEWKDISDQRAHVNAATSHRNELDALRIAVRPSNSPDDLYLQSFYNTVTDAQAGLDKVIGYAEYKLKNESIKQRQFWVYYDELFADLVAVLYAEDPHCVSDAIKATAHQFDEQKRELDLHEATARDFAANNDEPVSFDVHNYFSKARSHIWSRYLSNPAVLKNKKSAVMLATLKAIAKVNDYRVGQTIFAARNWAMLNDELIAEIDRQMLALNMP
jgi:hypothetical protein